MPFANLSRTLGLHVESARQRSWSGLDYFKFGWNQRVFHAFSTKTQKLVQREVRENLSSTTNSISNEFVGAKVLGHSPLPPGHCSPGVFPPPVFSLPCFFSPRGEPGEKGPRTFPPVRTDMQLLEDPTLRVRPWPNSPHMTTRGTQQKLVISG